ncbi:MAG: hypothetical protein ISS34_05785 [Candidatus Omnitrophica bacterium]|nr:hypothetical protein [Candidatus Omnitrophota bacterium]
MKKILLLERYWESIKTVIARRPWTHLGRRSNLKTLALLIALCLIALPAYAEGEEAEAPSSEESSTGDAIVTTLGDETPDPTTGVAGSIGFLQESFQTDLTTGAPDATPGGGISGSAMPFLSESFQTDLATGAATMSIPITVPPGRKNMQPNLALSYSSNNSNGICGVGWAIPANYIQRSTKDGIPSYDLSDTFLFMSSGSNAELVNIENNEYRAKIESAFMKYVYDGSSWIVYDKSGTQYRFGYDAASRLQENNSKVFGWYLDKVIDVYGNYLTYIYDKPDDGQIYLKEIRYTYGADLDYDKSIVFNYEDRSDKLYSYRSGWKISTSKRLDSIKVYLVGTTEPIWRYELTYGEPSLNTSRSLLRKITVYDKTESSLPPKTFTYQTLE